MATKTIIYQDKDTSLEGYLAYDDTLNNKRPAVLVAHDWSGRNAFACEKADQLAQLGYIGFALDMYGNAKLGHTNEEKSALIQPFVQDRALLRQRITAAFTAVKELPIVDESHIAIIGFCFGGLCALDLARSGAMVQGVVSFHGLLHAPSQLKTEPIKSKILVLHGYDDPMVPPEQVNTFAAEMTTAEVDWQIHMYGNTMHGFTNPMANDKNFGAVYDATAEKRSWQAMKNFLVEVLLCQ
jgi:dienelactone hydrolase